MKAFMWEHIAEGFDGRWFVRRTSAQPEATDPLLVHDMKKLEAALPADVRGQFTRSNIRAVLNAGGEVAHQPIGLQQAPGETVKQLGQLLRP